MFGGAFCTDTRMRPTYANMIAAATQNREALQWRPAGMQHGRHRKFTIGIFHLDVDGGGALPVVLG
jgi:hypothetical protein